MLMDANGCYGNRWCELNRTDLYIVHGQTTTLRSTQDALWRWDLWWNQATRVEARVREAISGCCFHRFHPLPGMFAWCLIAACKSWLVFWFVEVVYLWILCEVLKLRFNELPGLNNLTSRKKASIKSKLALYELFICTLISIIYYYPGIGRISPIFGIQIIYLVGVQFDIVTTSGWFIYCWVQICFLHNVAQYVHLWNFWTHVQYSRST